MSTSVKRLQRLKRERFLKAMAPVCFWTTLALLCGMYVSLQHLPGERNESGHFIARGSPEMREAPSRSPASIQPATRSSSK